MGQPYPQQQAPQPPPVLLSSMNDVPGYRVQHVFGEVFGLTVRSRNAFSDIGAGFKGLVGGEQKGMTKLLHDSRNEALWRLREAAVGMGANAVLAMRFESGEAMPGSTEIAAYGTAVFLVPENPGQQQQQQQQQAQPPQQGQQGQQGQQQAQQAQPLY